MQKIEISNKVLIKNRSETRLKIQKDIKLWFHKTKHMNIHIHILEFPKLFSYNYK